VIAPAFITHWRAVVPWAADHQVEQHRLGVEGGHRGERLGAAGHGAHLVARVFQQRLEHAPQVGFVVYDEEARAHAAGKVHTNVVPPPGASSAVRVPPCAVTA